MNFHHIPVLLSECIEGLNIKEDGIYVDGTLGGAGHSSVICQHLGSKGHLIGIDQDKNALLASKERLKEVKPKVSIINNNFRDIRNILNELNIEKVDGVLLDLGVSSHQLDEPSRGFSYMHDAKLDMRMNQDREDSAYELINYAKEEDLYRIIRDYGEEKWAKRIAQFIAKRREKAPINTTFELVDIIKAAIPKAARKEASHPAKRTFQAIRIAVNSELDIIEPTILDIVDFLKPKGRLCIITFHSLEDRIVKNTFKLLENPCRCSKDFPVCVCGQVPKAKIVTKKPILPSAKEMEINPRSKSAKLRILEKL